MIFDFILVQLDRELDRLSRLRTIMAELGRLPSEVAAEVLPAPAAEAAPPQRRRRLRVDPALPPVRRVRKANLAEPRALTASIPSGPVVIPAASVRQREVLKAPGVGPAAELSPEALLKDLSKRWGTRASVAGTS